MAIVNEWIPVELRGRGAKGRPVPFTELAVSRPHLAQFFGDDGMVADGPDAPILERHDRLLRERGLVFDEQGYWLAHEYAGQRAWQLVARARRPSWWQRLRRRWSFS